MNEINISELSTETTRERIEAYLAGISDGKAVLLTQAMEEAGGVRKTWKDVAGDRMILRVIKGKATSLVVNAKTAAKLAKESA